MRITHHAIGKYAFFEGDRASRNDTQLFGDAFHKCQWAQSHHHHLNASGWHVRQQRRQWSHQMRIVVFMWLHVIDGSRPLFTTRTQQCFENGAFFRGDVARKLFDE